MSDDICDRFMGKAVLSYLDILQYVPVIPLIASGQRIPKRDCISCVRSVHAFTPYIVIGSIRAPYNLDFILIYMFRLKNMPLVRLSKAAYAKAVRLQKHICVDGTKLPKKHNSPTFSSFSPSRMIRCSGEVMTLH